jgi:hypothetical protein
MKINELSIQLKLEKQNSEGYRRKEIIKTRVMINEAEKVC